MMAVSYPESAVIFDKVLKTLDKTNKEYGVDYVFFDDIAQNHHGQEEPHPGTQKLSVHLLFLLTLSCTIDYVPDDDESRGRDECQG